MSRKLYDVVHGSKFKTGGEEKTKWTTVGAIFESDKGALSLKLEYVPTGIGEKGLWLNLFEPKARTETGQGSTQKQPEDSSPSGDDSIPF